MSKKNILIYAEPHPLRNSVTEFAKAAAFLVNSFSCIDDPEINWRVFSNENTLEILRNGSLQEERIISPNAEEQNYIISNLVEWSANGVERRNDLVLGRGIDFNFYCDVLRRIKSEYDFDIIFIWSENSAARKIAAEFDINIFHVELGPTRFPFKETFYLDVSGTNGFSSTLSFPITTFEASQTVPTDTWLSAAFTGKDNQPGIMEQISNCMQFASFPDSEYAIVCLQLGDDLNTIIHSKFGSPQQFLGYTLPLLLQRVSVVLVKGHPGVDARPTNLELEIEALDYAKTFGNRVQILDRHLPSDDYLMLVRGAKAVLSINSSSSFEASLLGTPGFIFGEAVYDVGHLQARLGEIYLQTGHLEFSQQNVDRTNSFLFRHYLHEYIPSEAAKLFRKICAADHVPADKAGFLEWLVRNVDHGLEFLDREFATEREISRNVTAAEAAKPLDSTFRGFVDSISISSDGQVLRCQASGWVGRLGHDVQQVEKVALWSVRSGLLASCVLSERSDVILTNLGINLKSGFELDTRLPLQTAVEDLYFIFYCKEKSYYNNALESLIEYRRDDIHARPDRLEDLHYTLSIDGAEALLLAAHTVHGEAAGFVDSCFVSFNAEYAQVSIKGWVARRDPLSLKFVAAAIVFRQTKVLALATLTPRPDVRNFYDRLDFGVGFDLVANIPKAFVAEELSIAFFSTSEAFIHSVTELAAELANSQVLSA